MAESIASKHVEVSGLGAAFLPGRFADACSDGPIRRFAAEGGNRNQAMRFLKKGGTLVITGAWPALCALHQEIMKREDELVPAAADRKERTALLRSLRRRILTTLDCLPLAEGTFAPEELAGFLVSLLLADLPRQGGRQTHYLLYAGG